MTTKSNNICFQKLQYHIFLHSSLINPSSLLSILLSSKHCLNVFPFYFFPQMQNCIVFPKYCQILFGFLQQSFNLPPSFLASSNHFIYSVFRSSYTKFKSYLHYSISQKIELKIKISAFSLFSKLFNMTQKVWFLYAFPVLTEIHSQFSEY